MSDNDKKHHVDVEAVSEMLVPYFGEGAQCRVTTRLKLDDGGNRVLTVLATDEKDTVQIIMAEGVAFYEANKPGEKKLDA